MNGMAKPGVEMDALNDSIKRGKPPRAISAMKENQQRQKEVLRNVVTETKIKYDDGFIKGDDLVSEGISNMRTTMMQS